MATTIVAILSGLAVVPAAVYLLLQPRLTRIHGSASSRASAEISLTYSPNNLSSLDLFAIVVALLAKYVPGTRAYRTKLVPKDGGFPLPLVRLRGPLRLSNHDVQKFEAALAIPFDAEVGEKSTELNAFFLVNITNPLLLILLSQPGCPIRPAGSVNTRNEFKFHQSTLCGNAVKLQKASEAGHLWFTATFGGPSKAGRPKRRGVEFDITIQVWFQDDPILTQNLSFLQFLPKSSRIRYRENEAKQGVSQDSETMGEKLQTASAPLILDTSAPRLWAASCKDYNPIHVSGLGAKLFGFSSVILHGNHAVALAVELLVSDSSNNETILGRAKQICWHSEKSLKIEMSFVKPVSLPAKLEVQWSETSAGVKFELQDKAGKLCISGLCTSK